MVEVQMTPAQLVTRNEVEAALKRLDATNHDDANLLKAVIQNLERQVRQLTERLDKAEGWTTGREPKAKG